MDASPDQPTQLGGQDQQPPPLPERMPFSLPRPTHRPREEPKIEYEATTELRLGEFEDAATLSVSEARLVLNKIMGVRRETAREEGKTVPEEPESLTKTMDYVEIFARFKDPANLEAVGNLLEKQTHLELFERAQLGNLCCDNAEEAKSLIPSLQNKISDAELQELLDELTKLRNFVE
ncbi:hypothetical protein KEM56_007873 [Ascosphaera pollenicola]|nr:hypothetical protein KEM56_007873 [Ascosphaera pollenicola]